MEDSTWRERALQYYSAFLITASDVLLILRNEMEVIIGESNPDCKDAKIREVTHEAESTIIGVAADPM